MDDKIGGDINKKIKKVFFYLVLSSIYTIFAAKLRHEVVQIIVL